MTSPVDSAVGGLGDAFVSGTVNVNGTTLHYVRGGVGPAAVQDSGHWVVDEQPALVAALIERYAAF